MVVLGVLGLVLIVAIAATTAVLAHLHNLCSLLLIVFQDSRIEHLHLFLGPTTVSFHD